jgi:hypothetical protein
MKRISAMRLYDGITYIDDEIIEEAESYTPKVVKISWARWGALAASLVIVAAGAFGLMKLGQLGFTEKGTEEVVTESTETTTEAPADGAVEYSGLDDAVDEAETETEMETATLEYSIRISAYPDRYYYIADYSELALNYNLPETEGEYVVTEADLGEELGTVTESDDPELTGLKAYRFNKLPDTDEVCIVEQDGRYEFYIAY